MSLPSRLASFLGGAAVVTAVILASETRAQALVIPYTFSDGITFSYTGKDGTFESALSGSFSLDCGTLLATDCVNNPGTETNPTTLTQITDVQITQPSTTFVAGYYFVPTSGLYYLEFRTNPLDTASGGSGESLRLALAGPLPTVQGGSISLITTGSFYCSSNNANLGCPGGNTGSIDWFSTGASVIVVPSPFFLPLLVPATLMMRLRKRYASR